MYKMSNVSKDRVVTRASHNLMEVENTTSDVTSGSTQGSGVFNQDIMFQMAKLLDEKLQPINESLSKMQNSLIFVLDEVQKIDVMDQEISELKGELKKCEGQNIVLKKENKDLRDSLVKLEVYSRKENLKFLGIKEDKKENIETIIVDLLNSVNVDICHRSIVRAHRIGIQRKHSSRPVLVRFHHYKDKMQVVGKKKDLLAKNVTIVEDYPDAVNLNRKLVLPTFFKALEICPELQPHLLLDKLVLNDRVYTADDLQDIEIPALRPAEVFTRSDKGVTAYYSKYSPFSNHFRCTFNIDGKTFSSVEQFFMFQKAMLFGDKQKATEILADPDPVKAKKHGYSVKNFNAKT